MENDLSLSFNNPQQVRYFLDRAAHRRRIGPFDDLIQFSQTQPPDDLFLVHGTRDYAAIVLNPNLRRHRFLLLTFFLLNHAI